ncbi:MAG TPA: orotidine 5-phosphate decarboxylase, partial [Ignisphaera aggregans]|nr:orotidine 5-phosphate decarboxylase [Ignisphaera aggregans]
GVSEDDVIREASEVCKRLGVALIVDLIHVKNPVTRASNLAELGIEAVLVHVGVDVQRRRGISVKELLSEIKEIASMGLLVAVAGGIKPEEVDTFIDAGARIVIIGSAIVKSTDPINATRVALTKMRGH